MTLLKKPHRNNSIEVETTPISHSSSWKKLRRPLSIISYSQDVSDDLLNESVISTLSKIMINTNNTITDVPSNYLLDEKSPTEKVRKTSSASLNHPPIRDRRNSAVLADIHTQHHYNNNTTISQQQQQQQTQQQQSSGSRRKLFARHERQRSLTFSIKNTQPLPRPQPRCSNDNLSKTRRLAKRASMSFGDFSYPIQQQQQQQQPLQSHQESTRPSIQISAPLSASFVHQQHLSKDFVFSSPGTAKNTTSHAYSKAISLSPLHTGHTQSPTSPNTHLEEEEEEHKEDKNNNIRSSESSRNFDDYKLKSPTMFQSSLDIDASSFTSFSDDGSHNWPSSSYSPSSSVDSPPIYNKSHRSPSSKQTVACDKNSISSIHSSPILDCLNFEKQQKQQTENDNNNNNSIITHNDDDDKECDDEDDYVVEGIDNAIGQWISSNFSSTFDLDKTPSKRPQSAYLSLSTPPSPKSSAATIPQSTTVPMLSIYTDSQDTTTTSTTTTIKAGSNYSYFDSEKLHCGKKLQHIKTKKSTSSSSCSSSGSHSEQFSPISPVHSTSTSLSSLAHDDDETLMKPSCTTNKNKVDHEHDDDNLKQRSPPLGLQSTLRQHNNDYSSPTSTGNKVIPRSAKGEAYQKLSNGIVWVGVCDDDDEPKYASSVVTSRPTGSNTNNNNNSSSSTVFLSNHHQLNNNNIKNNHKRMSFISMTSSKINNLSHSSSYSSLNLDKLNEQEQTDEPVINISPTKKLINKYHYYNYYEDSASIFDDDEEYIGRHRIPDSPFSMYSRSSLSSSSSSSNSSTHGENQDNIYGFFHRQGLGFRNRC